MFAPFQASQKAEGLGSSHLAVRLWAIKVRLFVDGPPLSVGTAGLVAESRNPFNCNMVRLQVSPQVAGRYLGCFRVF